MINIWVVLTILFIHWVITFLQYKKIYNNCVTTDTSSESDYYGGSTSSAFYQYEVEKLYNELSDLNLVNLD
jgi:hypothetical protein